ncbi:hypothetical protein G3M48_008450 [Beauveria asiatica]|uniref:Uncharacterized protein n=1 Tax=Beauveria asiatica TaxID=1069075 RepID=A0AAW0RKD4_9HYPO
MPVKLTWIASKPRDGLFDSMERLALEIAEEGEYNEVKILPLDDQLSHISKSCWYTPTIDGKSTMNIRFT